MRELTILTPAQLAERLQVPVSWIYKHIHSLPVLRCGKYLRFDWQSVVEHLRNGEHIHLQPSKAKKAANRH